MYGRRRRRRYAAENGEEIGETNADGAKKYTVQRPEEPDMDIHNMDYYGGRYSENLGMPLYWESAEDGDDLGYSYNEGADQNSEGFVNAYTR